MNKFYKFLCIAALLSFILGMAELIDKKLLFLPARTHISIIALWLITYVVCRHDTNKFRMKWLFNNRWMIFIGKISYGIYLYHKIIPPLTDAIAFKFFNTHIAEIEFPRYLRFLIMGINFILLIFISWISWNFIEKFFLSFKKNFGYQKENSVRLRAAS